MLSSQHVVLIESGSWCQGIHKVSSHQDLPKLDPIEAWICKGNNAADSIAQHAFGDHPSLIHTWEILKEELAEIEKLRKWTHHVLIRVGHLAMDKLKEKRYTEDSETQVTVHTKLPYIHWTFPAVLPSSLKSYAIPEWKDIHDWILSLHSEGETMYLSWYQLYADFSLTYPGKGPYYKPSAKKWKGGKERPEAHFAQKSRWFATFFTKMAKQLDFILPTRHCRPSSFTTAFWSACLPVTMTIDRHQRLENWLRSHRALYRRPKDFEFMDG